MEFLWRQSLLSLRLQEAFYACMNIRWVVRGCYIECEIQEILYSHCRHVGQVAQLFIGPQDVKESLGHP